MVPTFACREVIMELEKGLLQGRAIDVELLQQLRVIELESGRYIMDA